MAIFAVSLVLPEVTPLFDRITTVLLTGAPKKIAQFVVTAVWVWVMSALFPRLWQANKRFKNKVMEPFLLLCFGEVDTEISLANFAYLNNFLIRIPYSPLVRDFIAFSPDHWQPSFLHAVQSTSLGGVPIAQDT